MLSPSLSPDVPGKVLRVYQKLLCFPWGGTALLSPTKCLPPVWFCFTANKTSLDFPAYSSILSLVANADAHSPLWCNLSSNFNRKSARRWFLRLGVGYGLYQLGSNQETRKKKKKKPTKFKCLKVWGAVLSGRVLLFLPVSRDPWGRRNKDGEPWRWPSCCRKRVSVWGVKENWGLVWRPPELRRSWLQFTGRYWEGGDRDRLTVCWRSAKSSRHHWLSTSQCWLCRRC